MMGKLKATDFREKGQLWEIAAAFCTSLDHIHVHKYGSRPHFQGWTRGGGLGHKPWLRGARINAKGVNLSERRQKNRKSDAKRCIMMHFDACNIRQNV